MATNTMDAIKKKMQAMKTEKEAAFDKADQLEQKLGEQKLVSEKHGEEIAVLQKRVVQIETDMGVAKVSLTEVTEKLETSNKNVSTAEGEVQTLTKKVRGQEEEFESATNKQLAASEKLEQATKAADDSERARKVLENRMVNDEERIVQLEKELEDTILLGEESDRKFEEASRKLATTEVDLSRAEAGLEAAEAKCIELEEELKVVGNNMKSLEIFETEAAQRAETYEETIRDLTERLTDAESRVSDAERTTQLLQKEVDKLEEELTAQKDKYKVINNELDSTFAELTGF
jgi:tropomyosin-1